VTKKFELTDETMEIDGHIVYRIKAIRDFGLVKAGDAGGFVEAEDNLSHEGDCWVYDNAKVFGDSRVSGHAIVHGNAKVYGSAWVYGNSSVCGDASVYDKALVYGTSKVYGNAKVFGDDLVFGDDVVGETDDIVNGTDEEPRRKEYVLSSLWKGLTDG